MIIETLRMLSATISLRALMANCMQTKESQDQLQDQGLYVWTFDSKLFGDK